MSALIERLRKHKDDRGMMANLRCILVENKRHRAWPALNRLGISIDDEISAFVAGLFAMHPEETNKGNLGNTCKSIEQQRRDRRGDDDKMNPTERRFQHLIAADRKELLGRVARMILLAKSQSVPVNYEKLESDLRYWGDRTKTDWASSFWAQSVESAAEEAP